MIKEDGGLVWILKEDDWISCADLLAAADYPLEFALSTCFDAEAVEGSCLAGFMPMSSRFSVPPGFPYGVPESTGHQKPGEAGETRMFFTPKLHRERCILDPAEARITATTRKAAKKFRISVNKAFPRILAACIQTHGDGWLTPFLTKVFTGLHEDRRCRQARFVSVELWHGDQLVAGELGYTAGTSYASLSGFRNMSGAGTVQLAALAGILAGSGFRIWDLGMPMDYKTALGGQSVSRHEYLTQLRDAYQQTPILSLEACRECAPVRLPVACTRA